MKRILSLFLFFFVGLISLTSCSSKKTNIVSTCFAGYDFANHVAGDLKTSSMLLNPGEELHDYSPSISDVERIISSELFIYIGGESDEEWVEKQILPEIDSSHTKVINMMDIVKSKGNAYNEEDPESADVEEEEEEDEEFDEHVWNSITNAKLIVSEIANALSLIDSDNKDTYEKNRDSYLEELNNLDLNIKNVLKNKKTNLLVFADRFPLLYFVKEYDLEYDAAFKGCESAKEANPKTIEGLVKKVVDNHINVIFTIELSESNIASTVKTECEKKGIEVSIRTFYTMHNVSKEDYQNKISYVDFMKKNIESLEIALS